MHFRVKYIGPEVLIFYFHISVGGGIVTEKLFKDNAGGKNGGPKFSFMEQQLWMYFYGIVLNLFAFFATNEDYTRGEFLHNLLRE